MRIREELDIFWKELTGGQKAVVVAIVGIVLAMVISGWGSTFSAWNENRKLENEKAKAEAEAVKHLENAANLARKAVEAEKKNLVLEAQRDGKQTEAEKAAIDTADARLEYERTLRERRGDSPSTDQLCIELAALGHPCT